MVDRLKSGSRFVRGFAASIIVATSLAFASPALAETTSLVCEEVGDSGAALGTTTIFNVDYTASTVTMQAPVHPTMPAVITAQEIKFRYDDPPKYISISWIGTINRITGIADYVAYELVNGAPDRYHYKTTYHARCRLGTQKF